MEATMPRRRIGQETMFAANEKRPSLDEIAVQLKAKAIRGKTGTLVDATVVGSAHEGDEEARWSGHRSRKSLSEKF